MVFKYGMLIGELGRERTTLLNKNDVELPSDINGIIYKRFENSIMEAEEQIKKQLIEAGYGKFIK